MLPSIRNLVVRILVARFVLPGTLALFFCMANARGQDWSRDCQCRCRQADTLRTVDYPPQRSPYAFDNTGYRGESSYYGPLVEQPAWGTRGGIRTNYMPISCSPRTRSEAYYGGYDPYGGSVAWMPINQSMVPSGMDANEKHYVGRGVLGQKKLYSTGQPLRNALRFLTP